MELPTDLRDVVTRLLGESTAGGELSLDQLGEAIGSLAVSTEEIEAIFVQLEAAGRRVSAAPGGGGEARLKRVVAAARALKVESQRRPTLEQVATRAGLSRQEVLGALFLLRIMQRG
jgi:hypothetical protein